MIIKTAERIKELREQRGLSQAELAHQFGVTRSSVNAWEMGVSNPKIDKLAELAQYFHVSIDFLVGLENDQTIDISLYTFDEQELIQRMLHYMDEKHHLEKK